jgi:DNA-binding transcriptional LysR family regulator
MAAAWACKNAGMDWDDLHYVLAVARAGTLAGAARRLAVDETTVARRLAAVERALGTRLFERVEGSMRPTKAGETAIACAAETEHSVRALELGIGGKDAQIAGSVRLTAVPVLINRLLVPNLGELHARHPRLWLELVAEPRNVSLTRREADVALRLARPEAGRGLLARRLGQLDYAVYCASRQSADRLPWITYDEALAHLPHARWLEAASRSASRASLSVNDTETMLQAIQAGLGKSLLPCFVTDRQRGLRRLTDKAVVSRELWLLTHRALRHHASLDAVVDWLGRLVKRCLAA